MTPSERLAEAYDGLGLQYQLRRLHITGSHPCILTIEPFVGFCTTAVAGRGGKLVSTLPNIIINILTQLFDRSMFWAWTSEILYVYSFSNVSSSSTSPYICTGDPATHSFALAGLDAWAAIFAATVYVYPFSKILYAFSTEFYLSLVLLVPSLYPKRWTSRQS